MDDHNRQTAATNCDSRRNFLRTVGVTTAAFALPALAAANVRRLARPIRLGVITDLHQDVMHDGPQRLEAFLTAMEDRQPDAIVQLGDFAVPSEENGPLIARFNAAHARSLHVLGNHDTDGGYTTAQVMDAWGMTSPYYSVDIEGLRLIVLDGNEPPPDHEDGYPAHVGDEQIEWLRATIQEHDGPCIVFSHQPLAGAWPIDNAADVQRVLDEASDRVLLALNGHSHIDDLVRVGDVGYLHVNSASYVWVGRAFNNICYAPEIHAAHPRLRGTCPYRDALFTMLTIDPASGLVLVEGRESEWVGKSPAELGRDKHADLTDGEEIAPRIRSRRLPRMSS